MNCKPGDLAVVVRSKAGNVGRIVTCVRIAAPEEYSANLCLDVPGPIWVIKEQLKTVFFFTGRVEFVRLAPDEILRPLRYRDGEDESLTWAGIPSLREDALSA